MSSAHTLNRRILLQATTLGLGSLALPRLTTLAQTPTSVDEITIDLSSEPASLAPSQVYEVNGWSVVHSIFDAPFEYDSNGQMIMVAAESLTRVDDKTFEIKLRPGITFHDGTPLTAQSLVASYQQIVNPDTGSSIAGNFSTITAVDAVDDLTARIRSMRHRHGCRPRSPSGCSACHRRRRGNRYVESAGRDRPVLLRRVEARRVDHARGQPELQQSGQGQADRETGSSSAS